MIICVFLLSASLSFGQDTSLAKGSNDVTGVKGQVRDLNGAVIPNIDIAAWDEKNKRFDTSTGKSGEYSLALPEGVYSLVFSGPDMNGHYWSGFCPRQVDNYLIPKLNGYITLDMSLAPRGSGCRTTSIDFRFSEKAPKSKIYLTRPSGGR